MLPDCSFPYMIKLDEAGGLAVVSSLFVCRYERRYAAGERSFPRKAEVLRRSAVMCFNQLYQPKKDQTYGKWSRQNSWRKSSAPTGLHCFFLSYVFKLILFFKAWMIWFEFFAFLTWYAHSRLDNASAFLFCRKYKPKKQSAEKAMPQRMYIQLIL